MIIILGYDGLEYEYVKKFNCQNLMQKNFGKTDLSEFSEPRTIVLWSSFLTGKNQEKRILSGDLWSFKLKTKETFFNNFKNFKVLDTPGYNYNEMHKKERDALAAFFKKTRAIDDYDKIAFENHRKTKEKFFEILNSGNRHDIIMAYFSVADVVGHLSFGIEEKMKIIYNELDDITKKVSEKFNDATILIVSDHGMKKIGRFGDHSNYAFWSLNIDKNLGNPKITDFYNSIIDKFNK